MYVFRLGSFDRIRGELEESIGSDGEEFAERSEERVRSGFGSERSVFEDNSFFCGGVREGVENLSTDGIEDDAGAFAGGDLVDAGYQVLVVGDDDVVGSVLKELGLFLRGASDGNADSSLGFDHLDRCDADAAAGGSDEDEVSFSNVAKHDERAVCGHVLHPDGGSLFEGEAGGIFTECGDGDSYGLSVDAMRVEAEDAWNGAGGLSYPGGIDAGANGFDNTCRFVAVLRGEDRIFKILAVAEHDLGAVEAESLDAETNLAVGGLGNGAIFELKNLCGAGLVKRTIFTVSDMLTPGFLYFLCIG